MFTIKGKIVFSGGAPESIPNNSTLTVDLRDSSTGCGPSILLERCVKSIQDYKKGTDLFYEIVTDKMPRFRSKETVGAVINIGWVPSDDEWIRRGDYLNDTEHSVPIQHGKTKYNLDIEVIHYN